MFPPQADSVEVFFFVVLTTLNNNIFQQYTRQQNYLSRIESPGSSGYTTDLTIKPSCLTPNQKARVKTVHS